MPKTKKQPPKQVVLREDTYQLVTEAALRERVSRPAIVDKALQRQLRASRSHTGSAKRG